MMVLIDSSVWIDYLRSGKNSSTLDGLIDDNLVATNDLILTELVPPLKLRNRLKIIQLLNTVHKFDLSIQWEQLIDWQYLLLKRGINGISIPDLIIAQNVIQNDSRLYSLDAHFKLINTIVNIDLVA
jgi:hypothetical protein